MSNRNFYRVVLSNDFLGVSKEISAPNRYELDRRVENQKRIWQERVNRELVKQNKEQMKNQAEKLTNNDQKIMNQYESIIKKVYKQTSKRYYDSLLKKDEYKLFTTELVKPELNQVYAELQVPRQSFLEKIFKSKLEKRLSKENEANELYHIRENYYNTELQKQKIQYEKEKSKFIEEQSKYNELINLNRSRYENGYTEQIEEYFSFV